MGSSELLSLQPFTTLHTDPRSAPHPLLHLLSCWFMALTFLLDLCSVQLVLPEYLIHFFFCVMFLCAAEWLTLCLNLPLLAYHVWR